MEKIAYSNICTETSFGIQQLWKSAGKDIFARTHNTYKPNPNELYPVLRLLEDKGFVKSQWDSPDKRSRRIYTITTRGRQAIPYMIEQVLGWLNDFDALISTVREEFAD